MTTDELVEVVRAYVQERYPQTPAVRLRITLGGGDEVRLPIPARPAPPPAPDAVFVPNDFQLAILEALEGKALRTDALGNKVGDRGRLFRKPGALPELLEQGLVEHHRRAGYFRPDAPPEELDAN